MLLPRYSLRAILLGVTFCAAFSLILGQAIRGQHWAIVISVAVASLFVLLLFHALLFAVSVAMAKLIGAQHVAARTSRGGMQMNSDHQYPPASPVSVDVSSSSHSDNSEPKQQ